jgi:hypothetical protein
MTTKFRVGIFITILLLATIVFTVSGLPYLRLSVALAQDGGDYGSDDDDGGGPGFDDCGGIFVGEAVVGLITSSTGIYWEPNSSSQILGLTLPAGKTFWALGYDSTGEFVQIVIACNLVWVPSGTIGPAPDMPWFNTPLPDTVVS